MLQHLPRTGESAWFRATHPNSWWWTPAHDFAAVILHALQGANWQRGGGKGQQPVLVKRPYDPRPGSVRTADDLAARRAAQKAELAKRRAAKQQKGA